MKAVMQAVMKAAQISKFGGKDAVAINKEAARPEVAAGQVLIEVHAAGVNPVDWKIREGYLREKLQLPVTLGRDFSGLVKEVGAGVTGFKAGDEVYGQAALNRGSFAEFVLADAKSVALKPKAISFLEAGALPLAGVSAFQALVDHLGLTKGQKILIHGGAGGIGSFAIQIAKHLGAYVAATASTKDIPYIKELGADEAIDYKNQSIEELLRDYDAVFDTVGGETYVNSFKVLKKGGMIVSMLEEPDSKLMAQYGVKAIGQWTQVTRDRLMKLADLVNRGAIKVHLEKIFPLDLAGEALEYLRTQHPRGKVVLKIR